MNEKDFIGWICPKCEQVNRPDMYFCINCTDYEQLQEVLEKMKHINVEASRKKEAK